MKVCAIGDIHGTNKFLDCYMDIKKNDDDCEKIIVLGDHFDPYDNISLDEMAEKYSEFIDICKNDERVVSILGNHDLSRYIIYDNITNRTERSFTNIERIRNMILPNLKDSYLTYKIGNYLFSHAGVSKNWIDDISELGYDKMIFENKRGWDEKELSDIVSYSPSDYSGYGDCVRQGCTWIRPYALNKSAVDGYNQVVGHTQVTDIAKIEMLNGMELWLIDNQRKSKYLTLEIEESE